VIPKDPKERKRLIEEWLDKPYPASPREPARVSREAWIARKKAEARQRNRDGVKKPRRRVS